MKSSRAVQEPLAGWERGPRLGDRGPIDAGPGAERCRTSGSRFHREQASQVAGDAADSYAVIIGS